MGHYPFEGRTQSEITEAIMKAKFSFKKDRTPSPEAQDLLRCLIQKEPDDRLSLEACLCHPWVKSRLGDNPEPASAVEINMHKEGIILPRDVKDVTKFRDDLLTFTTKYRFSATLRGRRHVVVVWQSPGLSGEVLQERIGEARQALQGILRRHFANFDLPEEINVLPDGGYPSAGENSTRPSSTVSEALAPVMEAELPDAVSSVKEFRLQLRVQPQFGAGLVLCEERNGMRVEKVHSKPGQPGLLSRDLIVQINGQPLGPTPDDVKRIFGQHFCNGVWVDVRREPPDVTPKVRELVLKLRVQAKLGAGLELLEESDGMRVRLVRASPGQPGLLADDLIVEIDGESLVGHTPDRVKEIFNQHFHNGVNVKVRRKNK
jgi:hypothetical protein